MARIRSIKPEFAVSAQLAACSHSARLLFAVMWCFCDCRGVHPDNAMQLKLEIFPGDAITPAEVAELVGELVGQGLLARFEGDGDRYLHVTGWEKHQAGRIQKPHYKYPAPPSSGANSHTSMRTVTDQYAPDRIGEDRKGGERERRARVARAPAAAPPAGRQEREAKKRGTRIPDDCPGQRERGYAAEQGFSDAQIDRIAERFRSHWLASASPNAVKRDWYQAWRTWVLKDLDHPERGVGIPAGRGGGVGAAGAADGGGDPEDKLLRSRASAIQTSRNKNFARSFATQMPVQDLRRMLALGLVTHDRLLVIGMEDFE